MSLNPLSIAHLGIGRRPIVAALLGLWPDVYVLPVPVYVAPPGGSGEQPVRQVARRRVRELRFAPDGVGVGLATAAPVLEAVRELPANGHAAALVRASLEKMLPVNAGGEALASVRTRLERVPVFSGEEMLALAAWRWMAVR